ncbi:DUF397 domain-containing protein [Streptomyces kaniharaensis]|uniref:DUF397 domain-containing protein n=1 Tax=Streptomyces kaniharaensis TaxID=212423 RepID=A0A6N7KTN6_9ACTN|nr:DUF397 domain-containing protein [Streptomyces kaniharaensis]MQS13949.1 DUF397 domain-containing protein [Streptomyces kaniharaensis]
MTEHNLYELDLSGVEFNRACGGNQGGGDDTETCVTLGAVPQAPGVYAMGDSKRPDREPLLFTADELAEAGIDPARFGLSV